MQCLLQKVNFISAVLRFLLFFAFEVFGTVTVLDKGLMPLHKNSVGIQFYVEVENLDRLSSCRISSWSKDCCLTDGEEDCSTMQVHGSHCMLRPKDTDTIVFVYPTLYQHDQIGYCDFVLEILCGKTRPRSMNVKIPFDTRIRSDRKSSNLFKHYAEHRNSKSCESIDQDSFSECEAVNCNLKYGGQRPFFDSDTGKCVEASLCEADGDKELPDIVYVPSINSCRDLEHPLTVADIYALSLGTGVVTLAPTTEDVKIELKSNCSTISQNLNFLRDLINGNLSPMLRADTTDYKKCCRSAVFSILGCIIGVCGVIFSFICCVQTLVWLHKKIRKEEVRFCWHGFKNKIGQGDIVNTENFRVNSNVRNALLKEVIVKDIPVELRQSIVDVCQRMEKTTRKKKRYRSEDIGCQISLCKIEYDVKAATISPSSTEDDDSENEKLFQ